MYSTELGQIGKLGFAPVQRGALDNNTQESEYIDHIYREFAFYCAIKMFVDQCMYEDDPLKAFDKAVEKWNKLLWKNISENSSRYTKIMEVVKLAESDMTEEQKSSGDFTFDTLPSEEEVLEETKEKVEVFKKVFVDKIREAIKIRIKQQL